MSGKSAIVGTAVATVALAACATGALPWVMAAVAGGVAGNVADRILSNIVRACRDRTAGLANMPQEHDFAKGIRLAQLQALERCLRDCANVYSTLPTRFFDSACEFCRIGIGRCSDIHVKLNIAVTELLGATIEGILAQPAASAPSGDRAAAIAAYAEDQVLAELAEAISEALPLDPGEVALPAMFVAHFRAGHGNDRPRFLDLFGAFIAEQIRENAPFRVILNTGQLARIEGLAFDASELLHRLDGHFGRFLMELRELRQIVDRVTHELALSESEKQSLVGDLARIRAEQQGTITLVGGFLETMVGRPVLPEDFATALFAIVGNWKAAGDRIDALAFSQILSPRLTELRDRARTEHAAGRLDAAAAALAEISREEGDALARLETHAAELHDELELRRTSLAKTRATEAAVARAQLRYRDAARAFAEAAQLLASDQVERWHLLMHSAAALSDLGDDFGDNVALADALEAYDEALALAPREQEPLAWASTHYDRGITLRKLGDRERDNIRLEQAIDAFTLALEERTHERAPVDWARTKNSLGAALAMLGSRESGTVRIEQALAAYRSALIVLTRELAPIDWAMTQNNLGHALELLGSRESGVRRLNEALDTYQMAMKEATQENAPFLWAMLQNNYGNVAQSIGERTRDHTLLENAIEAYKLGQRIWTRARKPLNWAMTQNNIGNTLRILGFYEKSTDRLDCAIQAYQLALEERLRERVPLKWAATQNNLGYTLYTLGLITKEILRLEQALFALNLALQERTRDLVPLDWAQSTENLAVVLDLMGDLTKDSSNWLLAIHYSEKALEEYLCASADHATNRAIRLRDRLAGKLARSP